MEDRREKNPVISINLLPNGQDTYTILGSSGNHRNPNSSLLPLSIHGNGISRFRIPVHAFRFGTDHDASLMHSISKIPRGTLSFIETKSVIQDAFAESIGGLLSVVVKDLQLMGNSESVPDDTHDESPYQPSSYADTCHPSYAGSSMDPNYQRKHESHPSSNARSSADPDHQGKRQVPFIADNYSSLDEVISALREAGLESSNLILGIDFTKSNEWTGKQSFNRKSLHAIGNIPNPYEQAISIIGRTLSPFDEDNLIPCFGFGDGPTSFAPVIDAAIDIVEKSNGQYHVLVIIADGQVCYVLSSVTRSLDTPPGRFSLQEQATVNSIVTASQYPLSIILVGVGDGPWDAMKQFDDNIPQRAFDNFQFVNFTKIMSENADVSKKEAAFALAALMEIPLQYRAALSRQYFANVEARWAKPLPPPREVIDHDNAVKAIPHMSNFESDDQTPVEQACPICLTNSKDMAFGCGHLTCKDCGVTISQCPMCRKPITTRIRLYT
ncbi:hypothetical protein RHGRI_029624 [Rhododendron griersonianum]|uniref:RING-type domain-containing protein n=1 Tax=Rhododendron griersonianum TaxID=479676 RepID=A0AAV6IK11_9ERIC|nr:hypothetical protein RHGRI_029624 [Rhododendron griersonianum]